jgi:hypothetical protein
MDFELHLEKFDGTVEVKSFRRETLAEAWAHAITFMGQYKCVVKMLNKTAVREHQLRGSKN